MKKKLNKAPKTNKYPNGGITKSKLSDDEIIRVFEHIYAHGGLVKFKNGGGATEAENFGLAMLDQTLGTAIPGGLGKDIIKENQYSSTKFGRSLGDVVATKETMDNAQPLNKMAVKAGINKTDPTTTGMNEHQQSLQAQAAPIAKTGSKIGEMWAMGAIGGAGAGAAGKAGSGAAAGTSAGGSGMFGQMAMTAGKGMLADANNQPDSNFMSRPVAQPTMYQTPTNMPQLATPGMAEDPKITGTNGYGRTSNNPYYAAEGGSIPANAEVEKQENVVTPDGQFGQYNGPSHDQGGIPTSLPEGTKVFSDRLKMPGIGKTFAKLNKPNNTTKEDKILEDTNSNSVAKATASLMKLAKQRNSDKLFDAQEALKQSKIDSYTMKLGGIIKYPDGGKTQLRDASGFPIDSTGRRLSSEEQLGFNRPGYTYGNSLLAGPGSVGPNGSGTNPLTGNASLGLQNAGGLPPRNVNLGSFGDVPVNQPSTMSDAQFMTQQQARLGLPKQAYGGVQKFRPGGTQRLQPLDSPELEIKPIDYSHYNNDGTFNPESTVETTRADGPNTNNFGNNNTQSNKMDWNSIVKQGALGLANNAGNIYALSQASKVEKDKYDRITPKLLDPTSSLRDVDMQSKIAEYNIRNASSGNAGAYLANRSGLAASTGLAKDKIQREYQNTNAGISNAAMQYNAETHKAEDIANMQNRAASRAITGNAISNIGSNTVGQYKDTQLKQGDKDRIELIRQMYPAIKNNESMTNYYKTKYPDIWASIVESESSKTK